MRRRAILRVSLAVSAILAIGVFAWAVASPNGGLRARLGPPVVEDTATDDAEPTTLAAVTKPRTPDTMPGAPDDVSTKGTEKAKPADKTKPPKDDPPVGDPPVDDPPVDDPADPPVGDPENPAPDPPMPSALPGPVASPVCVSGDMEDLFTFAAPASGGPAASYVLSRSSVEDGPYSVVATAGPDARSFAYRVTEPSVAYYRIAAVNESGEGPPTVALRNAHVSITSAVPASGATLRSSNGEVVLTLPPAAFESTTTVGVEEIAGSPTGGIISLAGVYEITPSGTLGAPARLSVAYTLNISHFQVAATVLKAASLITYDEPSATWILGATEVVAEAGYLSGTLTHFSCWTAGTIQPHGTSGEAVNYCSGLCHDLSPYPGSSVRYSARDPQICYHCHGNPNAALPPLGAPGENVQGAITGAASLSRHPVALGSLYCTACHDPHADPHTSPALLKAWDPATGIYVQGGGGSAPGTDFCWTCHGSRSNRRISYLPGLANYYTNTFGDHKTRLVGTPHATLTNSGSIACRACHASHGSTSSALAIVGTVDGRAVSGNDQSLCRACHEEAVGSYSGEAVYAQSKHSATSTSTRASTTVAASESAAGSCQKCHNPHGSTNADYLRTSGADLCRGCHDVAGLTYPVDYSYQGAAQYAASGHAGLTGDLSYLGLSSASSGFAAWQSNMVPTPSSPGTPITDPAALDRLRAVDGVRLRTRLGGATGTSDYQMFRFKVPATSAEIVNATLRWAGYGEETPGYPVTISLWVPSTSSWQQVTSTVMPSQQMVTTNIAPGTHMDAEGYVYVLAQAKHVYDGEVTSGPTFTKISNSSIRAEWTTAGLTTSWVDYGLTTAYGTTRGSAARTTSHSVEITNITPGTWNFRVRSDSSARPTGDEGENYTSGNYRYGFPSPQLAAPLPPDAVWADVPQTRTCYWQSMAGAAGPYQYRLQLYKDYVPVLTSGWMNVTSYTLTDLGPGYYQWLVEARDASGLSYGWSTVDGFGIWIPSGSCPFLFTWDGDSYEFESDLMMSGKLGNKIATGYQKPNPQDAYTLRTTPANEGGRWKFRMVEERFEVDYIDRLQLFAADAPAGYKVVAEKPGVGGTLKEVAAQLHTVRSPVAPASAVRTDTGEDISGALAADDDTFVVLNEDRNHFSYKTIELDLGDVSGATQVKLLIDGVSAFFNSPEGTALSATFGPRTKVEVQRPDGSWYLVPSNQLFMPVPPEFARTYVFDITKALEYGGPKVRLTFLYKTYVDMIKVDTSVDQPITLTESPLLKAELRHHGIDGQKVIFEDVFEHVYGADNAASMFFPGAYTAYRDVVPLLTARDDKFVIMGGGDELAIEFGAMPGPAAGMERQLVVGTYGYYKDIKNDLPKTVEPLPFTGMSNYPYPAAEYYPDDPDHQAYQTEWNTRVVQGVASAEPAAAIQSEPVTGLITEVGSKLRSLAKAAVDQLEMIASGTSVVTLTSYPVDHRSLNTDMVALDFSLNGAAAGGECGVCHNVHGATESGVLLTGGRAASDGKTCTADGTGGCHDNAANSANGVDIRSLFVASTDTRSHHDVFATDQIQSGGKAGCADCHNPHTNNRTQRYSDPDGGPAPVSPLLSKVSASGTVYVLVGAAHDATPPVVSAVALTGGGASYASPTITWTTDEQSTSWIDWGLTAAYELGNESSGSPFGNNALVTAHSVQMSGLVSGQVYHYRIRTADALGNVTRTADYTYRAVAPPATPTMSDITTQTGTTGVDPVAVLLTAQAVTSSDGDPVEYQFMYDGATYSASPWLASPSWTTPAALYDGTHSAQVRARDSVHQTAITPWSAPDYFVVENAPAPSGSCPFLFTWDGDSYEFESDMMMSGKLANRFATGYQKPNPQDAYALSNVPVAVDGSWRFRLVEERSETDYIDQIQLFAADAPAGYTVLGERPSLGGAVKAVAAQLHTVKDPVAPLSAVRTDTGEDILAKIAEDDEDFAVLNEDRENFEYKTIELDLGNVAGAQQVKLVFDGVSAFYLTPAGIARSATFGPRTKVEVQKADGTWYEVPQTKLPVPPEFARTYVFDITQALTYGGPKVRLTFLYKTYIDMIKVDTTVDKPITLTEAPLKSADLRHHGIDATRSIFQEVFEFVYGGGNGQSPLFPGAHTKYGEVAPLLAAVDDKFTIIGGGDELQLDFEPLDEPAAGLERSFIFATYGYYKDLKNDLPKTVEPLPFTGMSNYPYPAAEHYPDDADHQAYQTEWNTRVVQGVASAEPAAAVQGEVVWRSTHYDLLAEVPKIYSVDTDYMRVRKYVPGGLLWVDPAAGWESQSAETAKPTPSAPGAAAPVGALAAVASSNNVYWRTDLASAEGNWNWQMFKFELGANALAELKSLDVLWEGHGEPTPGHPTAVFIWNPQTSQWVEIERKMIPTDANVTSLTSTIDSAYCLKCHDGAPPAGVVLGGITNIGATWNGTTVDYHGGKSGTGAGGELATGYVRGSSIPCSTCHDTHGSASVYHFPSVVNGRTLPAISDSNARELCLSCHVGSISTFHNLAGCNGCHGQDFSVDHAYYCPPLDVLVVNCLDCHKHAKSWTHPQANPDAFYCWNCASDHGGIPAGAPAF